MIEFINPAILVVAILVVISILTSLVSMRFGAPLLLIFLIIGFMAGEDGPGRIYFNNAPVAYLIGTLSLIIILFDSGFSTKLKSWKNAVFPSFALSTIGVIITMIIVGCATKFLTDFSWPVAFLTGAIVSSTDAAAVFFLLRAGGINIKDRIRSILEIESGSNDPMAILLTFYFLELIKSPITKDNIVLSLIETFFHQIGIGFVLGFIAAKLIIKLINFLKFEIELYPLIVLCLIFILFALVSMIGGSGFLAVYIAGIIIGNSQMKFVSTIHRFQSIITWFGQIFMFLTLGLLATPSQFFDVFLAAFAIALVLIFIARPFAVWLCLLPFDFNNNEKNFLAWVGLRGAVSILLAILPKLYGIPESSALFNIAFVVVLTSLLIQGWTIKPVAKKMRLTIPNKIGSVERIELDLPNKSNLELVTYNIHQDSPVINGQKMPPWAKPSLVLRNDNILNINKTSDLQPKDQVYIFATSSKINILDKLFAPPLISEENTFFEDFFINANASMKSFIENYNIDIDLQNSELTIGEYMENSLGGQIEVGDWLSLGGVELIVRNIDSNFKISDIGIILDSNSISNNIIWFLNWQKISSFINHLFKK